MISVDEIEDRFLLAGALVGLTLVIAGVKLWEIVSAKPCNCHDSDAVTAPASNG